MQRRAVDEMPADRIANASRRRSQVDPDLPVTSVCFRTARHSRLAQGPRGLHEEHDIPNM